LAAIARFLASPKEGTPPFINSLNDTRREKTGSHCMGNHGCENGINEKQSAANRQRAAPPAREAHVTLGDDRRIIREPKFVGGERKTKVGLGKVEIEHPKEAAISEAVLGSVWMGTKVLL
jgi:hypothetical protein